MNNFIWKIIVLAWANGNFMTQNTTVHIPVEPINNGDNGKKITVSSNMDKPPVSNQTIVMDDMIKKIKDNHKNVHIAVPQLLWDLQFIKTDLLKKAKTIEDKAAVEQYFMEVINKIEENLKKKQYKSEFAWVEFLGGGAISLLLFMVLSWLFVKKPDQLQKLEYAIAPLT
jgi:hypothetical protein